MKRVVNVPASVDQRLRNLASKERRSIDDVRTRYVLERFLYRLSLSPYRDAYLLKGAVALQSLAQPTFRPTKDVDLHGRLHAEPQIVQSHIRSVLGQDTSAHPDGLRFVQDSIRMEPIRPETEHRIHRLKLEVRLGPAPIPPADGYCLRRLADPSARGAHPSPRCWISPAPSCCATGRKHRLPKSSTPSWTWASATPA